MAMTAYVQEIQISSLFIHEELLTIWKKRFFQVINKETNKYFIQYVHQNPIHCICPPSYLSLCTSMTNVNIVLDEDPVSLHTRWAFLIDDKAEYNRHGPTSSFTLCRSQPLLLNIWFYLEFIKLFLAWVKLKTQFCPNAVQTNSHT
jgi:hypothetical protein